MKIGGADSVECYTYLGNIQDLFFDGNTHTRDVLVNHLGNRWFRLVRCLSNTLFLRKTSQESINLESSYLDCSLDTLCTRENLEG